MQFKCLRFRGAALQQKKGPALSVGLLRLRKIHFGPQLGTVILILILVGVGLATALRSFINPFWYDEICTVIVCRQPNASQIWKALQDVVDVNPPLYHLIARLARRLVWDDQLGYRLPSVIGLLGTIFFVYHILSRKMSYLPALVGAAFLLCTQLAAYASEARPYALMVGFISCAIFAWQRVDDSPLYSLLFGIALGSALAVHYYAIFVWPAFVLAEATVWLSRRFRIAQCAALLLGTAPIFFFGKLLLRARQYGQHFWAPSSFSQILWANSWLFSFGNTFYSGTVGPAGVSIMGAVLVVFVYFNVTDTVAAGTGGHKMSNLVLPIEECVLILMLMLLPLVAVLAAKLAHGGMNYRYMMPTILGGALAMGYLASKVPRRVNVLLLIIICLNYSLGSTSDIKRLLKGSLLEPRRAMAQEAQGMLNQAYGTETPIVISSGLQYLPLAFYTPANSTRRLYALADTRAALVFAGTDSVDLALLSLRRYFPLQVEEYDDFAARHREFLLISENSGRFDWWPARLSRDGYNIRLLTRIGDSEVFKVHFEDQMQSQHQ